MLKSGILFPRMVVLFSCGYSPRQVCYDYCVGSGAAFMALQLGHTCWCGAVHSVSDYGDSTFGRPECDSNCMGDVVSPR